MKNEENEPKFSQNPHYQFLLFWGYIFLYVLTLLGLDFCDLIRFKFLSK